MPELVPPLAARFILCGEKNDITTCDHPLSDNFLYGSDVIKCSKIEEARVVEKVKG